MKGRTYMEEKIDNALFQGVKNFIWKHIGKKYPLIYYRIMESGGAE